MTALTAASMNGKVCLVTGATSGIGLETARALASAGAQVWLHGRDLQRAQALAQRLAAETGNQALHAVQADFASLAQVRRLAHTLQAQLPGLDVLIHNAGLLSSRRAASEDGYELTFAVNHLAPFLLTQGLLDKLTASAPARVVIVASRAHRRARMDFADLMNRRAYRAFPVYARSKLANLLFMRALARRVEGTGVSANALHPGVVRSRLFSGSRSARFAVALTGRFWMLTPREGARCSVYVASAPELAGVSGAYFEACRWVSPSAAARSDADAERLWEESARLTADGRMGATGPAAL